MPPRPCVCKQCLRTERDAGRISQSGLCVDCGYFNMKDAYRQLREREGPIYDRWLAASQAAAARLIEAGLPNTTVAARRDQNQSEGGS